MLLWTLRFIVPLLRTLVKLRVCIPSVNYESVGPKKEMYILRPWNEISSPILFYNLRLIRTITGDCLPGQTCPAEVGLTAQNDVLLMGSTAICQVLCQTWLDHSNTLCSCLTLHEQLYREPQKQKLYSPRRPHVGMQVPGVKMHKDRTSS